MTADSAPRRGSLVHVDFRSGSRAAEAPSLVVRRTRSDRWLVLEIAGEMDLQAGPLLDDVGDDPCFVVCDLQGVTFMDCSSLRVLEAVQRRAVAAGGALRLASVSVQVLRILTLTRMDRAFAQFDSVRDATSLPVTPAREPGPRRAIPSGEVPIQRLQDALLRRMTVERAKGTLAQIHGISPADAFTLMLVYCRSHRRGVDEVARLVVEDPTAIPELTAWVN